MKKNYIYPILEVMPFYGMTALCVSGETSDSLGGGENGDNPWGSYAPRRTVPF